MKLLLDSLAAFFERHGFKQLGNPGEGVVSCQKGSLLIDVCLRDAASIVGFRFRQQSRLSDCVQSAKVIQTSITVDGTTRGVVFTELIAQGSLEKHVIRSVLEAIRSMLSTHEVRLLSVMLALSESTTPTPTALLSDTTSQDRTPGA